MLGLQARNTVIWEGAAPGCLEELGAQQALHGSAEQVTACSILQCHHSSIQGCRHYNRDLTLRSLLSLTGGIVCRGPQFCPASQRHGTSDLAIPEQNAALLASPLQSHIVLWQLLVCSQQRQLLQGTLLASRRLCGRPRKA